MLQMTAPYYLQPPWRLCSYWFSVMQFFLFGCGWFQSQQRAEKQPWGVCVRRWQLSIMCQWDESHPLGGRGGGLPFLPYLSFSFAAPHSPCLVIALSLTFYSPHSLLRRAWITLVIKLTLDFRRSPLSWESDVLLLIVCHFLDIFPPYHSNSINSCFSTSGRENEFHAGCCSNIQCKHALMHFRVYCES